MRKQFKGALGFVMMAVVLLALAGCVTKPAAPDFPIAIEGVWARPMTQGAMGTTSAVYGVLTNTAQTGDSLVGATSNVAQKAEIHESTMVDHVMHMKHVGFFNIPAGAKLELKPGGKHIMLIGLTQDLKVGDTFTLTLTFEKAGDQEVEVTVKEQS